MAAKNFTQIPALLAPDKFDFDAKVLEVRDSEVLLSKSYFYPNVSAQPCDTGTVCWGKSETGILEVELREGRLWHAVAGAAPSVGTTVHCRINRERRRQMSRLHTAAVLVAGVAHTHWHCDVSSCRLSSDGGRLDFTCRLKPREAVEELLARCNTAIAKGATVSTGWIDVKRADEHVSLYRSAATSRKVQCQPGRVVQIGVNGSTLERQFDIGTHVRDISELGQILPGHAHGSSKKFFENKGHNHFRIRFHLADL
jgi:misacylated tRNA(Ala) deacylase